ncbi:hypothetical protein [Tunturibacter empetritectus]|uniref:Porin n=1 Tax=Tunturiibacter empetritectus TaxID=3069691 RepID=A0A7W8IG61_9BACT|nr:hypothetical protein [Edaphobacter lichenicola]MBB5315585.1 hypothetical protein [Edaphobacter lichenicola]
MMSILTVSCGLFASGTYAQNATSPDLSEQLLRLTEAMARTQAQVEQSQHELDEMRRQVSALQALVAQFGSSAQVTPPFAATPASSPIPQPPSTTTSADIDEIHERQALDEAQIRTQDQTKVESESKYPVKVTGLLLINGFVNTKQVDTAPTPTLAVPGPGSSGASLRQTVLGIDARGPHLFGARSYADLSVDFDGNPPSLSTTNYTGYDTSNATLLRLRTAHAGLQWQHTQAYFSLDRPIFSPDTPTSLTAVAEPSLAWSGNLWTWNPQLGVTQDLPVGSHAIRLQGALVDVGDAPWPAPPISAVTGGTFATTAQQSRWPGVEARVALLGSKLDEGSHLGFGGYFAPHLSPLGNRFDAWAGTLDAKLLLPYRLAFSGSFYRGEALGGLGGGGFKDFTYIAGPLPGEYYFRPLDDVGGWAQLKEKLSERLEFNAAFGLDNVFSKELRPYAIPGGTIYRNLARNRTYTGNIIYSPSAYLLFSLEYRRLESAPVNGVAAGSNVIGVGAGYRF